MDLLMTATVIQMAQDLQHVMTEVNANAILTPVAFAATNAKKAALDSLTALEIAMVAITDASWPSWSPLKMT